MYLLEPPFVIGYFTQLIGFHFNGLEILIAQKNQLEGSAQQRLENHLQNWPKRGPEIVSYVRMVENSLRALSFQIISPPQTIEEYQNWVADANRKVQQFLELKEGVSADRQLELFRSKWLYAFAQQYGDAMHTALLLALCCDLQDSSQLNDWTNQQIARLVKDFSKAVDQIQSIAENTTQLQTFSVDVQKVIDNMAVAMMSARTELDKKNSFEQSKTVVTTLEKNVRGQHLVALLALLKGQ